MVDVIISQHSMTILLLLNDFCTMESYLLKHAHQVLSFCKKNFVTSIRLYMYKTRIKLSKRISISALLLIMKWVFSNYRIILALPNPNWTLDKEITYYFISDSFYFCFLFGESTFLCSPQRDYYHFCCVF